MLLTPVLSSILVLKPKSKEKIKRVYKGSHLSVYLNPHVAAFIKNETERNGQASVSAYINAHFQTQMKNGNKKET